MEKPHASSEQLSRARSFCRPQALGFQQSKKLGLDCSARTGGIFALSPWPRRQEHDRTSEFWGLILKKHTAPDLTPYKDMARHLQAAGRGTDPHHLHQGRRRPLEVLQSREQQGLDCPEPSSMCSPQSPSCRRGTQSLNTQH